MKGGGIWQEKRKRSIIAGIDPKGCKKTYIIIVSQKRTNSKI